MATAAVAIGPRQTGEPSNALSPTLRRKEVEVELTLKKISMYKKTEHPEFLKAR